jgi:regulator of protease activity HflC (stomatin/prohibitin superfamily)
MSATTSLPGVTLDPKAENELEAAFGVTSNAEELVRQNAARFTPAQREAMTQRVDAALTSTLYKGDRKVQLDENGHIHWGPDAENREFKDELVEAIGHPIEDAVVRGRGSRAVISYIYLSPRKSYEKDIIPYGDVFGDGPKQAARTPQAAADSVLSEAEQEAEKVLSEARAEAQRLAEEAAAEAQRLVQEAESEAQGIREQAQEDAPAAAAEAEQEAEKPGDGDAAAKRTAARSGSSRRGSSRGSGGSSRK